jgi:hypothetical protein
MSVNIFGSSVSVQTAGENTKYVDQKFGTLSSNLATKVDKSGNTVSGDLNIILQNDNLRTFGVADIKEGKSVSLLLGDISNQIRYNCGRPVEIYADHGTKFTSGAGDVCQLGYNTDSKARFFKDIIMNDNYITNLRDPKDGQDAANKQYVDAKIKSIIFPNVEETVGSAEGRKHVKNNVGLIPDLSSNHKNKSGFIVSATGNQEKNYPWYVFCSWKDDNMLFVNFPIMVERWIKVKCPEPVQIHKFSIKGILGGSIMEWKFQGSHDDDVWDDVYVSGMMDFIDSTFKMFHVTSTTKYIYYRFIILGNTRANLGLNHLQIYSVDSIM